MQEDLHAVGGTPAVMKYLLERGFLHGDCMTVTGKTLAENLADAAAAQRRASRSSSRSRSRSCRAGTSASCAATWRPTGRWPRSPARKASASTGRRKVFDSEEAMLAGLEQGEIAKGTVVVIRYEGPEGRPGHAGDADADLGDHGRRARARTWRCSPTAASRAGRTASSSATSRRKRRTAGRSRWCATAIASPSTPMPARCTSSCPTPTWRPAEPPGKRQPTRRPAACWANTSGWSARLPKGCVTD